MNTQFIRYTLGNILMILAGLMLLPLIVSVIYQESWVNIASFLGTSLVTLVIGFALSRTKLHRRTFYAREGFTIVSLSWILISFFSAIPFVLSQQIPSFIDAFFEMASGFTTTGASILLDVEVLSHSMLFWRSFSHFVGGMGVLVFALAILPKAESSSVHIMKAEMTGPTFGKLVSRLSSTARILYFIYFTFMMITLVCLYLAGLPFFESILLAFGTAGTGGFGVLNGSIAPYDSFTVEMILSIGMIIFSINFNLFYLVYIHQAKRILKSEELRWFLAIIAIAVLLISINLISTSYGVSNAFRDSFFTVASIISTTGYSTALFDHWPLFSQLILILLMFVGGMAGSTAGGLKVSRILLLVKIGWAEIKQTIRPNRVVAIDYEGRRIDSKLANTVLSYLVVYIIIFIVAVLVISLETPNLLSSFSTVAATLNNIGPGLGIVGPSQNFAHFSPFIKIFLSFIMIMGRLEIFPMIILFAPNTWLKRY
ncbi:TrkH family potassium uptake protein [Aerococcaceae bacterium INB8]|uniref:TrkH family potassium uptake protein n=1 Tax=Ruoffia halotolerans TaxID=2748684 RepID=A0A839A3C7_9LACT|nr:TrkH family potassium uptake protein [Ruoffia halotolerans]MBA5728706.1 TrkH family potassium uptake protein [Ruoffia halotolerans]